ncbi:tyrosine-type recombinase/integrase [Arcticibacter svalbardensis]|nr:tyrosine-type recombinase/integrase [Arcticibacter svalbardensis]
MAKPKFYLEPRPSANGEQAINMFYSFAGKRLQYYTGIRVEIKHFRPECNSSNTIQPLKSIAPYAAQNNKKLNDIANDAVTIVKATTGDNLNIKYIREQLDLIHKPKTSEPEQEPEPVFKHTFVTYYEQAIQDRKTGKKKIANGKNKGSRFTPNAIKNYCTTLSAVNRYLEYQGLKELPFENVNEDFYNDFMTFIYDVEKKEVSTFSGYIKDIKSIMNEATPGLFNGKPFVKPNYEADTIYLNDEQIDKIASLDLSDYTKYVTHQVVASDKEGKNLLNAKGENIYKAENVTYKVLDKVRDLALVGFYSGLRFSDFSNLDLHSIDGKFIKVKQIKTGARVTIPIMEKLKPVLAKYPTELPTVTNQRFNIYIKLVAKLAGLTAKKSIATNKGGLTDIQDYPLYTLVSSHCCRRSYATNMFNKGVPPMLIMAATGHKTEANFYKYIRTTDEQKANLLLETFIKLGL